MQRAGLLIALLALVAAGASVSLLQAAPGVPSPPAAMARLLAAEGRLRSGVVRFASASRSVKWDGEVDEAAARAELARGGKDYGSSSGTLRFSGDTWREEAHFTSAAGVTTVSLAGVAGAERRSVVSAASRVRAVLSGDPPSPSLFLNAALRGRLGTLLKETPWKRSQAAPGGVVRLSGIWQGRSLALTLDPKRDFLPLEVRVETRRASESGDEALASVQVLRIAYGAAAPPYPSRVEQLTVSRLGEGAHAVLQVLRVEEASLNGEVAPETLAIAIPKGAEVLDSRVGRAVRYQQGERDVTLAEVKALAEKQEADAAPPPPQGPKLGMPAPALALKDLEGRPVRLEDYRGKVVLLNWFASW